MPNRPTCHFCRQPVLVSIAAARITDDNLVLIFHVPCEGPWERHEQLPAESVDAERCESIGPAPEHFRCGLWRHHAPHPHSALIPTGAPWLRKETV